jgi:hypothetical protein
LIFRGIARKALHVLSATVCALALSSTATGQQAASMSVQFAFKTNGINGRFQRISKTQVESMITDSLSQLCTSSLRPWRCVSGATVPGLRFELYQDRGEYYIRMTLAHSAARPDLVDSWTEKLYTQEDLAGGVLPMNDNWVNPVRDLVSKMFKGSADSGSGLLMALKEVVPLGVDVALITSDLTPPRAVLPLMWSDYKDFANWKYRLVYHGDAGQITILAGGAGSSAAFKPDSELYQGILVVQESYQLGSLNAEPITAHLEELRTLVPVAFYVERWVSAPADLSLAP